MMNRYQKNDSDSADNLNEKEADENSEDEEHGFEDINQNASDDDSDVNREHTQDDKVNAEEEIKRNGNRTETIKKKASDESFSSNSSSGDMVEIMKYGFYVTDDIHGDWSTHSALYSHTNGTSDAFDERNGGAHGRDAAKNSGIFSRLSSESSISSETLSSDTRNDDEQQWQGADDEGQPRLENARVHLSDDNYYRNKRFAKYMEAGGGCEIAAHTPPSNERRVSPDTLGNDTRASEDQEWGGDINGRWLDSFDAEHFWENRNRKDKNNLHKTTTDLRANEPAQDEDGHMSSKLTPKKPKDVLDDDSVIRKNRFRKYMLAGGGCAIARRKN